MINTTYVIVPTDEITDSMYDSSLNDVIRYSLDQSKAILKFNTPFPDVAKGYKKYSHEEILEELQGSEWTEPF